MVYIETIYLEYLLVHYNTNIWFKLIRIRNQFFWPLIISKLSGIDKNVWIYSCWNPLKIHPITMNWASYFFYIPHNDDKVHLHKRLQNKCPVSIHYALLSSYWLAHFDTWYDKDSHSLSKYFCKGGNIWWQQCPVKTCRFVPEQIWV